MLFKKGNDFVEITQRISHDIVCSTWFIDTNLDFESLPIEFRSLVPETDQEGLEKLKKAVQKWADREEFKLISK